MFVKFIVFFFLNKVKSLKYAFVIENKFFYFKNSCLLLDYSNNLNFWFIKYKNKKY